VIGELNGLGWLIGLVVALTLLQRRLHFETQAIFLLLTRRADLALALFSLLFFPGVLIHEASHYLMARLVGVRTGRFSLLPQPLPDGRLQLGFVETTSTDLFRDALIGSAPLVAGGVFVVYAALVPLGLPIFRDGQRADELGFFLSSLAMLPGRPDFWLWFYLTFAVSSTMLPSASDRRAWLPLILLIALLFGLAGLFGAGPWLLKFVGPKFNRSLLSIATVFGISAAVHLILLPPLWLFRRLLVSLTGLKVE
jgi:hypothetical protein